MWGKLIVAAILLPFLTWAAHDACRLFRGVRSGAEVLAPDMLAFVIPWLVLMAVGFTAVLVRMNARWAGRGPPTARDVLLRAAVAAPIAFGTLLAGAFAAVMLSQLPGWWLEGRGYVRCPDRDVYRTVQGSRGPRRIADAAWARPEACPAR